MARYAGDGRWSYEEDYWDLKGARETARLYAEACDRTGTAFERRLTRRHWPEGPDFARREAPPDPSWLHLPGVRRIVKPRELREILAALPRD